MFTERPFQVGIDYDGVFVKKAESYDIARRATKFGLPTLPGVIDGISFLNHQKDTNVLGIYTVRPKWLREGQTRRQVKKRGFPVDRIVHTTNSPVDKIRQLFFDSVGYGKVHKYPGGTALPNDEVFKPLAEERLRNIINGQDLRQVILIDDSTEKVIKAAEYLYDEDPGLRPFLERFTHIAFNPKQPERFEGLIIPGVIHVVTMRDWSEIKRVMKHVKR